MKKIEGWLRSDRDRAGEGVDWLGWGWLHHDHVIDNRQGSMGEKMAMGKNGREMPLVVNSRRVWWRVARNRDGWNAETSLKPLSGN